MFIRRRPNEKKMGNTVTILTNELDGSTDKVIDWLMFYDDACSVVRINKKEDLKKVENYHGKNVVFTRKYRHLLTNFEKRKNNLVGSDELNQFLQELSQQESRVIIEHFIKSESNVVVGNKEPFAENKLYQLELAEKAGFEIPPTMVTNKRSELLHFYNKHKKLITKPLFNAISYFYQEDLFVSYTKSLGMDDINVIPVEFFPSLFQKEIHKAYEIRTFFFYDKCYSMCIFSQSNEQTSVDYRMYNKEKPNRTVPYELTREEEAKVKVLMKRLNLNTGSIDFIRAKTGELYFLEVNPEGQFGMVSTPCNYPIEKEIACKILDLNGRSNSA